MTTSATRPARALVPRASQSDAKGLRPCRRSAAGRQCSGPSARGRGPFRLSPCTPGSGCAGGTATEEVAMAGRDAQVRGGGTRLVRRRAGRRRAGRRAGGTPPGAAPAGARAYEPSPYEVAAGARGPAEDLARAAARGRPAGCVEETVDVLGRRLPGPADDQRAARAGLGRWRCWSSESRTAERRGGRGPAASGASPSLVIGSTALQPRLAGRTARWSSCRCRPASSGLPRHGVVVGVDGSTGVAEAVGASPSSAAAVLERAVASRSTRGPTRHARLVPYVHAAPGVSTRTWSSARASGSCWPRRWPVSRRSTPTCKVDNQGACTTTRCATLTSAATYASLLVVG